MSISSTLLLTAAMFTAQAESPTWDANPIYFQARGAIAVPARTNGDVPSAGVSVGIQSTDEHAFGMRFIYMADPPDNPLGRKVPNLNYALGPVVDWTYLVDPNQRASLFTTVSAGYVYSVPKNEKYNNVILPILEGGLGLRFSRKTEDGRILYAAPEIGFVPGAVAPLCAINIGMVFPGGVSSKDGANGEDVWSGQ